MKITHVIRGDDHVNNTPRQINILKALGANVPHYAHLSMILGGDGQKLSKRHGAVSVMQYEQDGYLPEAVINYLARLGWSHGNDEIFSAEQLCAWFDLDHITSSAAQFNTEKLNWLNQHYLKLADHTRLLMIVRQKLQARGLIVTDTQNLPAVIALYKERVVTINELADAAEIFFIEIHPDPELLATHLTTDAQPALQEFVERLSEVIWQAPAIAALIKEIIVKHDLKMLKLAMPLRVMLTGQTQTPSVDVLLALFPRELAVARIKQHV